jgi:hypothetical protein
MSKLAAYIVVPTCFADDVSPGRGLLSAKWMD